MHVNCDLAKLKPLWNRTGSVAKGSHSVFGSHVGEADVIDARKDVAGAEAEVRRIRVGVKWVGDDEGTVRRCCDVEVVQ